MLTCRDVLWYLVFCGFAVNYVLRINLNLTIVAMVLPYPKPAAIAQCNVQENSTAFWTNETFPDNNVSFPSPDTTNENITVLQRMIPLRKLSHYKYYISRCQFYIAERIITIFDMFLSRNFNYAIIPSTRIDLPGTSINRDWHWVRIIGYTGCRNCPVVSWPGDTERSSYSVWEISWRPS